MNSQAVSQSRPRARRSVAAALAGAGEDCRVSATAVVLNLATVYARPKNERSEALAERRAPAEAPRRPQENASVAKPSTVSAMRSSWLYLAMRSEVLSEPTLIWPQAVPVARSAMNGSSVSPERAETMAR